eukprot:CAMPEP_0197842646 /NCGR_PEP_ID=MMETSP1437-20131217/46856_1 /TAXON_ID=49252 ORGANISM="Eucampia antarctica, Strain CCMP1452" /NCGR_SAMPLE_ID=MMETSP1437 /ASSEMBLY_ACC=CAM_ASM_001096 /LENGTH=578 /DNA_ID=CAMNT_0043452549 /DNA_START=1 /DNA_END=1738 /DNA_ORIENTATION=-
MMSNSHECRRHARLCLSWGQFLLLVFVSVNFIWLPCVLGEEEVETECDDVNKSNNKKSCKSRSNDEVVGDEKKLLNKLSGWIENQKEGVKLLLTKGQEEQNKKKSPMMMFEYSDTSEDGNENGRESVIRQEQSNAWKEAWESVGNLASSFVMGNEKSNDAAVEDLLSKARMLASSVGGNSQRSFSDMWTLFLSSAEAVDEALERSFRNLDLDQMKAPALYYFIEHEDAFKHPSWKRRKHRFHKAVDTKELYQWHDALFLAELSYVDTLQQLELGITSTAWELVYAHMDSAPGEPSHFIAIQQPNEKIITVRGTKQFGDILSDGLLDAIDFRGGKAHAGIAQSGQYLVDKNIDLLQTLLRESKMDKIKLHLVGHSLGAGAASIAAIIFNQDYAHIIEASAIGFGCPALLSKDLSQQTQSYITTIVADSDVVPRLSTATITNAFLDIISYDWTECILEDLQDLLIKVQKDLPILLSNNLIDTIVTYANTTMDKSVRPLLNNITEMDRLEPVLIPPGECIHLFRDGSGVTGTHTPCDFFDSIDVTVTMIDDHLIPPGYHRLFLDMMRDYQKDLHFSFHHDI